MHKVVFIFIYISIVVLYGCNSSSSYRSNYSYEVSDSSMVINYAKGFDINYHNRYKEVVVNNPWKKGEIMSRYYLVEDINTSTPNDGIKLKIPISNVATSSCTQIEFIQSIGCIESISGVCTPKLIYNPLIIEKCSSGEIINLGDAFNINLERILLLNCDAIILSAYNNQDETSRRLLQSGLPVIFNNEWTEQTILGRAEWIKFISAFYNKEKEANDIFNNLSDSYNSFTKITDSISKKKSILVGGNFKGTWYVPGGRSYIGRLLSDAGADYFYKNDTTEQSIPMNFETVLLNFKDADVWLNAPTSTMKELIAMDEKHNLFNAAKNNMVFSFNKRMNDNGANDFWESGVMNPDLVLKDIIWALYPNILRDYSPVYIEKL